MIQWPLDYGANQRWSLLAANSSVPAETINVVNAGSGLGLFDGGQWVIVPLADQHSLIISASSGLALDDPDFATNAGTSIQLYQLNGGLNQQWDFLPVGNGNYVLGNASSRLFLDELDSAIGTFIFQTSSLSARDLNEQWQFSFPAY
jgi:hypothetical protein